MSEQEINQRLRSLHNDFDFLLDANVISTEFYDELTQKIPRRKGPWHLLTGGYNKMSSTRRSSTPVVAAPVADVPSLTTQFEQTLISPAPVVKSPPPPPTPTSPPPPVYGLAQAEALYTYNTHDEGDLPLVAGQRITILEYGTSFQAANYQSIMVCPLKQLNADWWRGELPTGQQGIFPSNYVRKIEANDRGYPSEKTPVPYQYASPQQYAPTYVQPQPQYQQPAPQQVEQPPPQQQEHKSSKLGQFGKNYGKTFVNATAWYVSLVRADFRGGGMTLGADVINKIF
jgi:hypothetical protein